ncbi:MAG TPA: TMEM165/GDT1 family protein [Egibacteraceae bacterium]|nr:TMEM165/GDT1 family protein [Egibacteraceae bacterium]
MELKTVATVFAALFLAELGDKTQLAVVSFAAGGGHRWSVLLGASLALVASTALAVLVGDALTRVVGLAWLQLGGAVVLFLVGAAVAVEAVGTLRGG